MRWREIPLILALLPVLLTSHPVPAQDASPQPALTFDQHVAVAPGRSLHLQCMGAGEPTVIFESGYQTGSSAWAEVAPSVAETTRACTYDRAGIGKSDPPPDGIRTVQESAADLHALLTAANLHGPLLFVGASFGGLIVRLYEIQHPDNVAGVVLVDGLPPGVLQAAASQLPEEYASILLDRVGGTSSDDHERIDLLSADALFADASPPPDVPTVVLASETVRYDLPGDLDAETLRLIDILWRAAQIKQANDLAGQLLVVSGSGHNIHSDQPQAVIDAVVEVVAAIRDPET